MIRDYLELAKPRITTLVLITTAFGYHLAGGTCHTPRFYLLLLGSGLVCAGSAALNHLFEREYDVLMPRTQKRPLPSGTLLPWQAAVFGVVLSAAGVLILWFYTNYATAFLSLLTSLLYLFIYTPLKRMTWLNTMVGAIPGSIPPLGGWAAATGGEIGIGAWYLFLILFFWQHPHFYVIAWMCKNDYEKAGFKMLPSFDHEDGRWTFFNIFLFMFLLIAATITPFMFGFFGMIYLTGVMIAGFFLFSSGMSFVLAKTKEEAVGFLKATVYYLPAVFASIVLDKWVFQM